MEEEKDIQRKTIVLTTRVPVSIEVQAEKDEYGDIGIKRVFNVSTPSIRDITESLDDDELETLDELFNEAD